MKRLKEGRGGFTLVEIMIVVAIISLLAAIAIPNLLRARHNANETSAIASLRTISTSCESYRSATTPMDYPASLALLGSVSPPYIDEDLADGEKQGYNFAYTYGDKYTFSCTATPVQTGRTGTRIFFVNESGVIRVGGVDGDPLD